MAIPQGNLLDYGNQVAAEGKVTLGALLEGAALFPVWKGVYLGPNLGLKYGARNPYEATAQYPLVGKIITYLDFTTGLTLACYF